MTLTKRARFWASVLGLATLVLGSLAVFYTTNQAGSVALLGVSIALLLLALVGRFPERGNVGQFGFTYLPNTEKLDSADPEERGDAAEAVLDQAERNVGALEPNARAVTRASTIIRERSFALITAAVADGLGMEVDFDPLLLGGGKPLRPDLVVRRHISESMDAAIPVEIRRDRDRRGIDRTAQYAKALGAKSAVLVAVLPPGSGPSMQEIHTVDDVQVFMVVSPESDMNLDAIRDAIRSAMDVETTRSDL